jgi:replicative DNA helicase
MYSKPPHVGDLRETGQIENDAHLILLLHRPWDEDKAKAGTEGEVIIAKQREGNTGAIKVVFDTRSLTFLHASDPTSRENPEADSYSRASGVIQ